ncbi:class II glutamine amidotransferase [Halalkalibacter alkaliphilus]|uniref:glutamine--fructose-6-phosphate transaminase (isomerizing) n=1 Tax=Halalkalibacter alkaliphilus TaxID=2917993 RepID=A0A9X2CUJ4_9BACI|nr:class II glutamine amidotransferase [Halalkalibacter alkaliphilus]MCL7748528.1 class II glutamine amidotransferase [Halalkalibacter alkaliphilus]
MCGIGGLIYKNSVHEKKTGEIVVKMLESLCRRGPDSTGVALLHPKADNTLYIDVNYDKPGNGEKIINLLTEYVTIEQASDHGSYVRAIVKDVEDEAELILAINNIDHDVSVASYGDQLEVLKFLGGAENLEAQFKISDYDGQVAIGHTRMATESKVDISHSQPLSCHTGKDLTIIHNGHITNYIKLRSKYEKQGYTFITGNDSEVIAVYLVDKIKSGLNLKEAMEKSLEDLDGSFSYIAITPNQVGLAKEPFGMKPMVIAETDDFVAFASESMAITNGFGKNLSVFEPGSEEVMIWNL